MTSLLASFVDYDIVSAVGGGGLSQNCESNKTHVHRGYIIFAQKDEKCPITNSSVRILLISPEGNSVFCFANCRT